MVGDIGFDLRSAGPKFRDQKTSFCRKVSLRNATGISHYHLLSILKYLVGVEGLEPPTSSTSRKRY